MGGKPESENNTWMTGLTSRIHIIAPKIGTAINTLFSRGTVVMITSFSSFITKTKLPSQAE